jgi:hypothetical protein
VHPTTDAIRGDVVVKLMWCGNQGAPELRKHLPVIGGDLGDPESLRQSPSPVEIRVNQNDSIGPAKDRRKGWEVE